MSQEALPCIVCGKALENVDNFEGNQPYAGTEFHSYGHYGSTIFDPMDGQVLMLNVCDDCLRQLGAEGKVLLGREYKPVVADVGPEELSEITSVIGKVRDHREPVPWHENLEEDFRDERLVLEPEEIGSELYPEVEYNPGILDSLRTEPEGT